MAIKYRLVPPHNPNKNHYERPIQTFKGHIKAGLAFLDPDFPISGLEKLVEQGELTLNLFLASRATPKLSHFAYLFGESNYSAATLVPLGTKTLAHSKPVVRNSWELSGEERCTIILQCNIIGVSRYTFPRQGQSET